MKRILFILLSFLFPILAIASDTTSGTGGLSFAPPLSDISVIFLANIFGVVDGVLHGTGSQIMGAMFSVFNSAVLALGGIVIMYTLLVSTMNTAHEGQMLGQKWSSIWVPLRSTLGLALMIPKASGYCLMQIFVMWIVVQGVGAADKIWAAALSYLNRGGVVVQAQMTPAALSVSGASYEIATGASRILSGQVCMAGLQAVLETTRLSYLSSLQNPDGASGPCSNSPNETMKTFCQTPVPDFFSTVNFIVAQQTAIANNPKMLTDGGTISVGMPNFDPSSPYAALNGICGTIQWKLYTAIMAPPPAPPANSSSEDIAAYNAAVNTYSTTVSSFLTPAEVLTAQTSRAIAIQQMFIDLATPAHIMVNNSPAINIQLNDNGNPSQPANPYSPVALQQFGVPYLTSGTPCPADSNAQPSCANWGSDSAGTNTALLFNGSEFQGAVADYNAIMLPTLTLVAEQQNFKAAQDARAFIQQANQSGWILAGSYFFYIVKLNAQSSAYGNTTDKDTGLTDSKFEKTDMLSAFGTTTGCSGNYAVLCNWLNQNKTPILNIIGLLDGSTLSKDSKSKEAPIFSTTSFPSVVQGPYSSTVNGFMNNAAVVQLPGQPGLQPPSFSLNFNLDLSFGNYQLPYQDFGCGFRILRVCVGGALGNMFYNGILRSVLNFFLNIVGKIASVVVMTFLAAPLIGMSQIFRDGVAIIQQPSVNPVVALANMGTTYINYSMELWIILIGLSVSVGAIPVLGVFIMALIALALPLITSWLGVMVTIGFITAYYIPFLPYMIFTFGSIAWVVVVIEAMVAAPIVALGVTHPEGNDAFGKGEHALMIILNVFLRPAMMIIGYIAAIAMCYVSVWIINAGFANALVFIQGNTGNAINFGYKGSSATSDAYTTASNMGSMQAGYTGWAGIYAYFFGILIYTTMYLIVVQKAFQLIVLLPDKVLRWIGSSPESIGQEAAGWTDEAKKQVGEGGQATAKAAGQMEQQLSGYAEKAKSSAKGMMQGPQVGASPTPPTPPNTGGGTPPVPPPL